MLQFTTNVSISAMIIFEIKPNLYIENTFLSICLYTSDYMIKSIWFHLKNKEYKIPIDLMGNKYKY